MLQLFSHIFPGQSILCKYAPRYHYGVRRDSLYDENVSTIILYTLYLWFVTECVPVNYVKVITKVDPTTNQTHYEYVATAIGEQSVFGKVYTNAIYTVVVLLLPLLLLLVLNTRIIREIRHLNERQAAITYGRTVGGVAVQAANGGGADRDENMTKVMVVIVFAFLVCHTPDRILQVG